MTNLFLHVNITVPERNKEAFSDQLKIVLRESALGAWKLEGGFWLQSPPDSRKFDGSQELREKGDVQFVNIWRLPEGVTQADISKTMTQLSETESYVKLDNLVKIEQQEIVLRINKPISDTALSELSWQNGVERGRFVRVRHYPFRANLGTFVFTAGALAPQWESAKGWKFLGTFQNITGLLNEFWDFWYVPESSKLETFERDLVDLVTAGTGKPGVQGNSLTTDFLTSISATPPPSKPPLSQSAKPALSSPTTSNPPHDGIAFLAAADYWLAK